MTRKSPDQLPLFLESTGLDWSDAEQKAKFMDSKLGKRRRKSRDGQEGGDAPVKPDELGGSALVGFDDPRGFVTPEAAAETQETPAPTPVPKPERFVQRTLANAPIVSSVIPRPPVDYDAAREAAALAADPYMTGEADALLPDDATAIGNFEYGPDLPSRLERHSRSQILPKE